MAYKRRTKQELIKDLEDKLEKLKSEKTTVKLSNKSPKVKEAADAISDAAKENGVTVADIIILIAKNKKTGLNVTKKEESAE